MNSLPGPGSLPAYLQIAELLGRDIAAGRLADGARLPPERRLAAELGVSVGTLRKALADLQRRGLLTRRQGSGNYVRHDARALAGYAMFRLELHEGGGDPTAVLLDAVRLPKPAQTSRLGPHPHAFRIRRVRSLSGQPVAVEEIWLDGRFAEALEPAEMTDSLYLFYRNRLGLRIQSAEDRVGLAPLPDWTPPDFPLRAGTPAGLVQRAGFDQTGAVAELSWNWFDTHRASYVARIS